ncbi:hypothetical protein [Streptomyces sp. NPDC001970]
MSDALLNALAEALADVVPEGHRHRATWTVALQGQGTSWTATARGEAAATVEAESGDLLLLVHGPYEPSDARFTHSGDRRVLDAWLSATAR